MKKIFYLIITLLLFMPAFVLADTDYHKAVTAANDYIRAFEDYDEYFLTGKDVTFVFDRANKTIIYNKNSNPEFTHGSFLSRYEYEISNSGNGSEYNNSKGKSYLSPGVRYWLVKNDSNYYYEELETKQAASPFVPNGVRVTGFVLPKTKATGSGTANSPWNLTTSISHEYGDYLMLSSTYEIKRNTPGITSNVLLDGDVLTYSLRVDNNNVDRVIPFTLYNDCSFISPSGGSYSDITYNSIFELDKENSYCTIASSQDACMFDLQEMYEGMNSLNGFNGTVPPNTHLDIVFKIKVNALKIGAEVSIQPKIASFTSTHESEKFTTSIERLVSFKSVTEEVPSSNIVFVIDYSGSMNERRLSGVRQSVFSFINYIFPDSSSNPNVNVIVTKFSNRGREEVIGSASNYEQSLELKRQVLNIFQNATGGTYYDSGLNLACSILYGVTGKNGNGNHCSGSSYTYKNYSTKQIPSIDRAYGNYIIFLSDGAPSESTAYPRVVASLNAKGKSDATSEFDRKAKAVTIYAIGYETGTSYTTNANKKLISVAGSQERVFLASADTLIQSFNSIYDEIGDAIGNYPTTKGEVDMTEILNEGLANKVSITITDKTTNIEKLHQIYQSIEEVEAANLLKKVILPDGTVKYYLNCTDFSNDDVVIGFYPKSLKERNANLTKYKVRVNRTDRSDTREIETEFEGNVTVTDPKARKVSITYDRNKGGGRECILFGLICNDRNLDIKVTSGGNETVLTSSKTTLTTTDNPLRFLGWSFSGDIDYNSASYYNSKTTTTQTKYRIAQNSLYTSNRKFRYLTLNANSVVNIDSNWETDFNLPTVTASNTRYNCLWNTQADGRGTFYPGGFKMTDAVNDKFDMKLYAICVSSDSIIVQFDLNSNDCVSSDGTRAKCAMTSYEILSDNREYEAPAPEMFVPGKGFVQWNYKESKNNETHVGVGGKFKGKKVFYTTTSGINYATFTAQWDTCPRDKYNDGSGYECQQCPTGFRTSGTGSTSQADCKVHLSAGEYFNSTSKKPEKCPIGFYSGFEGDISPDQIFECTACDNELTTDHEGSTNIRDCRGQ